MKFLKVAKDWVSWILITGFLIITAITDIVFIVENNAQSFGSQKIAIAIVTLGMFALCCKVASIFFNKPKTSKYL